MRNCDFIGGVGSRGGGPDKNFSKLLGAGCTTEGEKGDNLVVWRSVHGRCGEN